MQRFLTLLLPALFLWHGSALAETDAGALARELIRERVEALHATRSDNDRSAAEALVLFYAQRDHAPAWTAPERIARLVEELERLVDDGLEPAHYRSAIPDEPAHDARDLALRDIAATRAYLRALEDLSRGRTDRAAAEPLWRFKLAPAEATRDVLVMHAQDGLDDLVGVFEAARPDTPLYQGLRAAHAALREQAAHGDWIRLPPGRSLHPDDHDPRIALLRARLERAGYVESAPRTDAQTLGPDWRAGSPAQADSPGADHFDRALVEAVMRFQRAHYLDVDGIVGPATLAALNVSIEARLGQLRANLERARWLAHELEPHMLLVDVAGAKIIYFRDARPVWNARIQVGRASRPTPLLKSEITHFTFNPTWTVPPTILRKDKLPEIRKDIGYLAENRMRVLDHSGREIDPQTVDWSRPGAILLRQDAGPENALGQVAIRFPNPFHVYLHDTPSQGLFERVLRTTSSGCVRVERAYELVGHLIDDAAEIDRAAADEILASGRTRNVRLARPVPVLIAYWTADIDDDGRVVFRPDIYGRDAGVLAALAAPRPDDAIMPSQL